MTTTFSFFKLWEVAVFDIVLEIKANCGSSLSRRLYHALRVCGILGKSFHSSVL